MRSGLRGPDERDQLAPLEEVRLLLCGWARGSILAGDLPQQLDVGRHDPLHNHVDPIALVVRQLGERQAEHHRRKECATSSGRSPARLSEQAVSAMRKGRIVDGLAHELVDLVGRRFTFEPERHQSLAHGVDHLPLLSLDLGDRFA